MCWRLRSACRSPSVQFGHVQATRFKRGRTTPSSVTFNVAVVVWLLGTVTVVTRVAFVAGDEAVVVSAVNKLHDSVRFRFRLRWTWQMPTFNRNWRRRHRSRITDDPLLFLWLLFYVLNWLRCQCYCLRNNGLRLWRWLMLLCCLRLLIKNENPFRLWITI